ncbi:uncharacterized protein PAC_17421 [Phialocephala subalpina]|uniref:Uncharacterized protein n=1 Tax=Phialocephala subalpina TaxID=576137 RepID=A0A1L7XR41_9HELO|nr:uncharacterized protein PAC_17421 [Phialocephala subalpina]
MDYRMGLAKSAQQGSAMLVNSNSSSLKATATSNESAPASMAVESEPEAEAPRKKQKKQPQIRNAWKHKKAADKKAKARQGGGGEGLPDAGRVGDPLSAALSNAPAPDLERPPRKERTDPLLILRHDEDETKPLAAVGQPEFIRCTVKKACKWSGSLSACVIAGIKPNDPKVYYNPTSLRRKGLETKIYMHDHAVSMYRARRDGTFGLDNEGEGWWIQSGTAWLGVPKRFSKPKMTVKERDNLLVIAEFLRARVDFVEVVKQVTITPANTAVVRQASEELPREVSQVIQKTINYDVEQAVRAMAGNVRKIKSFVKYVLK